ncbi:hypothetical protein DITRI_Ditri17bG0054300 [Diplodiscus trichospermus]
MVYDIFFVECLLSRVVWRLVGIGFNGNDRETGNGNVKRTLILEMWKRKGKIELVLYQGWSFRFNRNQFRHQGLCLSVDSLVAFSSKHADDYRAANSLPCGNKERVMPEWTLPSAGSLKMNIEASYNVDNMTTFCGMVVRDEHEQVRLSAATSFLGILSPLFMLKSRRFSVD